MSLCPHCHGRRVVVYQIAADEADTDTCPTCAGSGNVTAEIAARFRDRSARARAAVRS